MADKSDALQTEIAAKFGDAWDDTGSGAATLEIKEGSTVLIAVSLDIDAFGTATSGRVDAQGLPKQVSASAAGKADSADLTVPSASGTAFEYTGLTVGTTSEQVVLDAVDIAAGDTVNLVELSWTDSDTV